MWTAVLSALTSAGLAVDMKPGALRRRLDDIYLHRSERGSTASAVHEQMSPNLAETQPMSVEICFRLNIWPLQQLSAFLEFHFLLNMECQRRSRIPRAFTAVDDCGRFTGRLGWSHGNTLRRTLLQNTFASQRKVIANSRLEGLTILRELAAMRIL